ncbi:hypothetical protein BD289DRAFT_432039 [Coniella lustricola]|uniref:Uncharacterized protein n=1 Tax=Coniella lustricola TaxID=2025994 RepID=A0A2T3AA69_9PEZI|nr:hypothetical protein BD289DRAFT_432039 [Coniella lustricola]
MEAVDNDDNSDSDDNGNSNNGDSNNGNSSSSNSNNSLKPGSETESRTAWFDVNKPPTLFPSSLRTRRRQPAKINGPLPTDEYLQYFRGNSGPVSSALCTSTSSYSSCMRADHAHMLSPGPASSSSCSAFKQMTASLLCILRSHYIYDLQLPNDFAFRRRTELRAFEIRSAYACCTGGNRLP